MNGGGAELLALEFDNALKSPWLSSLLLCYPTTTLLLVLSHIFCGERTRNITLFSPDRHDREATRSRESPTFTCIRERVIQEHFRRRFKRVFYHQNQWEGTAICQFKKQCVCEEGLDICHLDTQEVQMESTKSSAVQYGFESPIRVCKLLQASFPEISERIQTPNWSQAQHQI